MPNITIYAPGTAYDEVGNRLTHTKGGTARYYNYLANSNRLSDIRLGSPTGAIESAFIFDDEGRLIGQTGVNARIPRWDAKGRLNALTAGGKTKEKYFRGQVPQRQGNRLSSIHLTTHSHVFYRDAQNLRRNIIVLFAIIYPQVA